VIAAWREWMYQNGFLRAVDLPAFTVSVGNISLGGTGKSPFVMYLCDWAAKRTLPTAVLTRGYKRKHTKLEIVPPGAALPDVSRLGDEPWMIKRRHPGISLLVHADRARMAKRHWQSLSDPKLIILDDAFQHWKASRHRDVLMLDASESLTQGTFPFGRLREKATAVARADLVVITRANSISPEALYALENQVRELASSPQLRPWKKERSAGLRIVSADYEFDHFFGEEGARCERPAEKALVLAAGVAKPDGVRALAHAQGLPVKEEIYFPDHHSLSTGDLARLRASLGAQGDSALLVTEKDWARWRGDLKGIPHYGIRVKFRFLGEGERVLHDFLREVECSISR
jgi:tetraacyldisaccharide 4'-kinase